MPSNAYERIYSVVRRIPPGRVATYGEVAELAGLRGRARQVGYALHALPRGTHVPWHRVLNAQGKVSLRRTDAGGALTQRLLLEREGVTFDAAGRVRLETARWKGSRRAPRESRDRSANT